MNHRLKHFTWTIVKVFFKILRLDVFLKKPGYGYMPQKPNYHYVPDYYGRSATKQADIRMLPIFGSLAKTVIQHQRTFLYYDRLYTIYQVLKNLIKIPMIGGQVNFAEVGVYKGGGSYFIASAAEALGFKKATLHCFDTFEGHSAEDVILEVDSFHKPKDFSDVNFLDVQRYLANFNNVILYKGRFQDMYVQIEGQKFHFIHLDVDIYEPTSFALNFFDQHLAPGGTIVVDDYGYTTCPGAKKAVDEFVNARSNYFSFQLLTGQCILIRINEGR